jgi:hypothetical protein
MNNCLGSNANGCVICKENSSLESDGFCYTHKDNNCEDIYVRLLHNNFIGGFEGTVENGQANVWALVRNGCDKCRSTFINVSYTHEYDFCMVTKEREDILMFSSGSLPSDEGSTTPPTLKTKRMLETTDNCLKYDLITTSICIECSSGYILNPLTRTCIQIANCSKQSLIYGNLL